MSLIHWWSLNGDTKDYGINNVNLTNSNGTVDNSGKIGKCYYLSYSAGFTGNFNTKALMSGECSFALWVKIPETEYKARVNSFTYDSSHVLMNSRILGTNGSYSDTGLCLDLQTNNIYDSGSFSNIYLCMGWRDSVSAPVYDSYEITFNTWYHVVVTKDNDKKMCMYVNGSKVNGPSTASAGTFPESYFYINNGGVWGWGAYNNSNAPMFVNDVRIYDHALSVKEIKEISKGLVLHYTFEDPYVEATTNLLAYSGSNPTWSDTAYNGSTGQYGYNDNSNLTYSYVTAMDKYGQEKKMVKVNTRTNGVAAGPYVFFENLAPSSDGLYKTVSFDIFTNCSGFYLQPYSYYSGYYASYWDEETKTWVGGTSTQVSIPNLKVNQWNHIVYRFLRNGAEYDSGPGYLPVGYTTSTSDYWLFDNLQIEEKDHATPYVNGTRSAGTVYDSSGYGNDGTVTGNLQIVNNSGYGQYSAKFDGSSLIKTANLTSEGRTASFWYKGVLPGTKVIFCDAGSKLGAGFYYNSFIVSSQADEQPYFTLSNYSETSWNHFCIIRGISTNTSKLYLNGVEQVVAGNNQWWTHSSGLWIGGRDATSESNITGSIADFKIYATALSASDILAEYNRKAAIDKNGNLFTGEIVEETENLLTTENLFNGRVNTSATTNVGEIVNRNGYLAYRLGPDAFWSGDASTSKNICKGQFQSGQYVFDIWIDVDDIYYSGNNSWVPGGLEIYYTDSSTDYVTASASSTQGRSSFQHIIVKSNANKTISGLGVYYYIGTPSYIRCDSVICKVSSYVKIKKNNVLSNAQIIELPDNLPMKTLSDGSQWANIYAFNYDISNSVWNSSTAKYCDEQGKFSYLGSLGSFIPEDGWYEFLYAEGNKNIRWKQSYNPLSRATSGSSGTSSEYVFIDGTSVSDFYGLTRYASDDSSGCYLRGVPYWWGAIAPYQTDYDVFPGLWGTSSGNHQQELWIRIDNTNYKHILKMCSYGILKSNSFNEV